MRGALFVIIAALACAACGSPRAPSPVPEVVYSSSEGIALRNPSGSVHYYRFPAGPASR